MSATKYEHRHVAAIVRVILVLLLASTGMAATLADETTADAELSASNPMARQILITVAHDSDSEARLLRAMSRSSYGYGQYDSTLLAKKTLQAIADDYQLQTPMDAWQIETIGEYCAVFQIGDSRDMQALVSSLADDARVASAQIMSVYRTSTVPSTASVGVSRNATQAGQSSRYSDPYFERQYSTSAIQLERLHQRSTGKGVKIALIDTAVDRKHADFSGLSVVSRSTIPDAISHSDDKTHGTAMLGILAATQNNDTGIVGLAPDAQVLSLAACWYPAAENARAAVCNSLSIAAALDTALRDNADIINLSLSGPRDALVERIVASAIAKGKVIVASDPLEGELRYPALLSGVVAVSAASFSQEVPSSLDAALPNHNDFWVNLDTRELLSTAPFGSYDFFHGASVSSAFTSGLIALNFNQKNYSYESLMQNVADDMGKFHFSYQLRQ